MRACQVKSLDTQPWTLAVAVGALGALGALEAVSDKSGGARIHVFRRVASALPRRVLSFLLTPTQVER